jgi:hypothetical protein
MISIKQCRGDRVVHKLGSYDAIWSSVFLTRPIEVNDHLLISQNQHQEHVLIIRPKTHTTNATQTTTLEIRNPASSPFSRKLKAVPPISKLSRFDVQTQNQSDWAHKSLHLITKF